LRPYFPGQKFGKFFANKRNFASKDLAKTNPEKRITLFLRVTTGVELVLALEG